MSTPSLPSNDPLQKLLREALHLQQIAKGQNSLRAKADRILAEYSAKLHNQENWIPSGVITVIHTSETGEQTTLGMFQELKNKYVKDARRLVRVEPDGAPVNTEPKQEFVRGQFWLNGKQVFTPEPNYHADPKEQELIRDYLKRTAPISLTQQLKDLQVKQAESILHELLHSDITWQRVYP